MNNILPIFTSHYSLGRSILTLEKPDKNKDNGSDSIFSIIKEENLNQLILLEDNMSSDIEAFKYCDKNNIQLVYGIRIYVNDIVYENKKDIKKHRLAIFARNSKGIFDLRRLYSAFAQNENGFFSSEELKKYWTENLKMVIPFYNSFLYYNTLTFSNILFDVGYFKDVDFFVENNSLGFDFILRKVVNDFCKDKYLIYEVKSIYYKSKNDIDTYMIHKIACSRSFSVKERTLEDPKLDDFCSNEFCIESWKEEAKC